MFDLHEHLSFYMYSTAIGKRCGVHSCLTIVRKSALSPISGDAFLFFTRDKHTVLILRWDGDGFILYQKTLEEGTFPVHFTHENIRFLEISADEFYRIMRRMPLKKRVYHSRNNNLALELLFM